MTEQSKAPASAHGLLSRREILRRGFLGAAALAAGPAALAALPAVLAACNGTTVTPPTPRSSTPGLTGRLRVGTNLYVGDPKLHDIYMAGLPDVDAAFAAKTGLAPTHSDFRSDGTHQYLTFEPDDVCLSILYIPGYRLQFLGPAGLLVPLDDVWGAVKDNFSAAVANAVTANDGHVYGIPFDFSPWVFFYRKSIWASKGYEVPTTWTELLALCKRMTSGNGIPIAVGVQDPWLAMGAFDMLNMRLNGYDFRIGLLTGKEKWTDQRVIAVFEAWRELIPYYSLYNNGQAWGLPKQSWLDAVGALEHGEAGMLYVGLFLTGGFGGLDASVLDDLDFFEFPYLGNQWDAERVLEAPIDIWVMPSKSPTLLADLTNAKAYLDFWAKGSTQLLMHGHKPGYIPTARDTDTSQLDRLSKKAFELVGGAHHLTQSFEEDTYPGFGGSGGMGSFIHAFVSDPTLDVAAFTQQIQQYWDGLPPVSADVLE
ncbi:MAG: ABC transporter substrate-binding protein [Candidatus Limnocylindrales bacterium]